MPEFLSGSNRFQEKSLLALMSLFSHIKDTGGDPGERLEIATAIAVNRMSGGEDINGIADMLSAELTLAGSYEIPYIVYVDALSLSASLLFLAERLDESERAAHVAIECLDGCVADARDLSLYSRLASTSVDVFTAQGDTDAAKQTYERLLSTTRRLSSFTPDPRTFVKPLIFLAQYYFRTGDPGTAQAQLKECETQVSRIRDECSRAANELVLNGSKALLYCTYLELDTAEQFAIEALGLYKEKPCRIEDTELEDFIGALIGLHCLAVSFESLSLYCEAASLYQDEIPLVMKGHILPPGTSLPSIFNSLGFASFLASDDEDESWTVEGAREAFESATSILTRTGMLDTPDYSDACFFLGLTYLYDHETLPDAIACLKLSEMIDRALGGDTILLQTHGGAMAMAYAIYANHDEQNLEVDIPEQDQASLDEFKKNGGDITALIRRMDALEMVSRDLFTSKDEETSSGDDDDDASGDEEDLLSSTPQEPEPNIPDDLDRMFLELPGDILLDDAKFDDLIHDLSLSYETDAFIHDRGGVLYNRSVFALRAKDFSRACDFSMKAAELMSTMPDTANWAVECYLVAAEAFGRRQLPDNAFNALSKAAMLYEDIPGSSRIPNTDKRIFRTKRLLERLSKKPR